MMAIALNTMVIFVGGFWPDSLCFEIIDAAFTMLFAMEAVVKIKTQGWRCYWQDGWNRFDFIIIILALPTILTPLIENSVETSVILALRGFRLIKSFKMFSLIPNINNLARGIKAAVKTSSLVVFAFVVFLLIFSVLSSTIFGNFVPEYFGNPGISLYSTFRLFTVEGWYELPDAIAQNGSFAWGIFARIYFVILLFLGGIIGMSLVNSIFVDAMAEDNNEELIKKISELEEKIDKLINSQNLSK